MRINVEQLKQALQAVDGRYQGKGDSEQETDFQDMISQILSMMNMSLSGQSEQGQQMLSSVMAPMDQNRVSIHQSVVNQFMAQINREALPQSAVVSSRQQLPNEESNILEGAMKKEIGSAFGNIPGGETMPQSAASLTQQWQQEKANFTDNAKPRPTINIDSTRTMHPEGKGMLSATDERQAIEGGQAVSNGGGLDSSILEASTKDTQMMNMGVPVEFETEGNREKFYDTLPEAHNDSGLEKNQLVHRFTANKSEKMEVGSALLSSNSTEKTDLGKPVQFQDKRGVNPSDKASSQDNYVREADGKEADPRSDIAALQNQTSPLGSKIHSEHAPSSKTIGVLNMQDIATELSEKITILKEGDHSSLKMKLKPEQLGQIEVRFRMKGGCLSGEILVETVSAREAMESQLQDLKNRLRNQNVILNEIEIGLYQNSQQHNQERRHGFFQRGTQEQKFSGHAAGQEKYGREQLHLQTLKAAYPSGITGNSLDLLA